MGCHTYFYKKSNRTQQQANDILINELQKSIIDFTEYLNNPADKDIDFLNSLNWTPDVLDNLINLYKRQIRMIENGFCQKAVWYKQPDNSIYIENKGFYEEVGYYDLFRIGYIPDFNLYSHQSTLLFIECVLLGNPHSFQVYNKDNQEYTEQEFSQICEYINKHKGGINIMNNCYTRLDKFWSEYPDGIINFN